MRSVIVVPVTELVEHTSTRARGKEAHARLVARLSSAAPQADVVVVDLSGARMVSGSFMDEFVLNVCAVPGGNTEVIFRVANEEDADRLRRVCAVRSVRCNYQLGERGPIAETPDKLPHRPEAKELKGAFFTT